MKDLLHYSDVCFPLITNLYRMKIDAPQPKITNRSHCNQHYQNPSLPECLRTSVVHQWPAIQANSHPIPYDDGFMCQSISTFRLRFCRSFFILILLFSYNYLLTGFLALTWCYQSMYTRETRIFNFYSLQKIFQKICPPFLNPEFCVEP